MEFLSEKKIKLLRKTAVTLPPVSACSELGVEGGGANCVPSGWHHQYTKTSNFPKVVDKNVLKVYQKA